MAIQKWVIPDQSMTNINLLNWKNRNEFSWKLYGTQGRIWIDNNECQTLLGHRSMNYPEPDDMVKKGRWWSGKKIQKINK